MAVHADQARKRIAALADRLGVELVRAAAGVIEIINANMMGAVRVISVEQGKTRAISRSSPSAAPAHCTRPTSRGRWACATCWSRRVRDSSRR
jgi:N-methylhydantoinase A/oxoprolinase/acetone carboxylase beta subunit